MGYENTTLAKMQRKRHSRCMTVSSQPPKTEIPKQQNRAPRRVVRGPSTPPVKGPAAVTQADFIEEQMLLLGAGAAVMNQLADPGVGVGVAEHSTTLYRPVDRLRTTLAYVYMMTLGTEEEQAMISRMVNGAHKPVVASGRYNAFDPELQLWVAATLVKNGLDLYQRVFGLLDEASKQRIYEDGQIFGTALQVQQEQWPETYDGFLAYWDEATAQLTPDPLVQAFALQLLDSSNLPVHMRPLMALQSLMTRGLIEPQVREVLNLSWSRREQFLFDAFWVVFPPVYRLVPRPLRTLGARLVVRDTRKRFKKHRRVI